MSFANVLLYVTAILASYGLIGISYTIPTYYFDITQMDIRPSIFSAMLYVCLISFNVGIIAQFGVYTIVDLPGIETVYQIRSAYKATVGSTTADLIPIFMYTIGPFSISKGIVDRELGLVLLGMVTEVVIYSISGFRTTIGILFGMLVLYLILNYRRRLYTQLITIGFISVIVFSFGSIVLLDFIYPKSILFGRLLFTPGFTSGLYYDYFLQNPKDPSRFLPFFYVLFERIYSTPIPEVIGQATLNQGYLNGSFVANGFASFGYLGVVLYGLVLMTVFWVFDSLSHKGGLVPYICLPGIMLMIINTSPAIWLDFSPILSPLQTLIFGRSPIEVFTFGEFVVLILLSYAYSLSNS
jgi:hypothetical protein